MAKVSTNISLDAETKAQAQALLSEFGMDLSTAVNIFLKQMVYEHAIPFSVYRNVPNAETIAAIEETEEMAKHPERYPSYSSANEMMEDLLRDEA